MSDLRERFERHQAGLLNIDYEELRDQFDRHEEIFGKRYVTFSDFEKEFELWQACWNHQQAIIDQLKAQLNNMEACYIEKKKQVEDQQKRVDGALFEMQQLSLMLSKDIDGYEDPAQICQSEGVDMGVRILEKALRGAND